LNERYGLVNNLKNKWLVAGILLMLFGGSPLYAQVPTPDLRSDLNQNGRVDLLDLLVFHLAWRNTPAPTETVTPTGPTATRTITATPTLSPTTTSTRTPTPSPTLSPTIAYTGRVYGTVTANGTPVTINLLLEPEGGLPAYNTLSIIGNYEFSELPIGYRATISTPLNVGFSPYSAVITIGADTEHNIFLVASTPTPSFTATTTSTGTPTRTFTRTITQTPTITGTATNSYTPTITETRTQSFTRTITSTRTTIPTQTDTNTPSWTRTPTPTNTVLLPTPTVVDLVGTWTGNGFIDFNSYPLGMTKLSGSMNATISFRGGTFFNVPLQTGQYFHYLETQSLGGQRPTIELTGVFVTGNLIQGNMVGDLRYQASPGAAFQGGTFFLQRQN
jgi:hypothetical protein